MASTAGPLPFRKAYPEFAARSKSKKYTAENLDILHGWRKYPKKPETRRLTSSLGNVYDMPGEDLDNFIQYMKSESEKSELYTEQDKKRLKNVQTPADYIDFVFDPQRLKTLKKQQVVDMPVQKDANGETGHIVNLTYNSRYMLFKVTFWNGTICCFFNVPSRVVALLMHYAENGTMAPPGKNGKRRHALGVEFWNLIRIRGTVHSTRYPFQYVTNMNAGPRETKYEYTTAWNDKLQRDVQIRVNKEEQTGEDKQFVQEFEAQEEQADKQDVIYDYEPEDLVVFFENGPYDELIGKANAAQRKLLIQAEAAYNADKDIGDIETLLRKTGMMFPSISELHAKYD